MKRHHDQLMKHRSGRGIVTSDIFIVHIQWSADKPSHSFCCIGDIFSNRTRVWVYFCMKQLNHRNNLKHSFPNSCFNSSSLFSSSCQAQTVDQTSTLQKIQISFIVDDCFLFHDYTRPASSPTLLVWIESNLHSNCAQGYICHFLDNKLWILTYCAEWASILLTS